MNWPIVPRESVLLPLPKKGDPSNAVTGPVVPPVCGREKSFTRKPDKVSPHLKPPEHPRAGCSNSLQRDVHIGYGKIIGYIRPLGYFGDGCSLGRVAEMMTLLDMRKQYHHRLYTVQGWLHCWPVIFPVNEPRVHSAIPGSPANLCRFS